jgi:hypothetical protein
MQATLGGLIVLILFGGIILALLVMMWVGLSFGRGPFHRLKSEWEKVEATDNKP